MMTETEIDRILKACRRIRENYSETLLPDIATVVAGCERMAAEIERLQQKIEDAPGVATGPF